MGALLRSLSVWCSLAGYAGLTVTDRHQCLFHGLLLTGAGLRIAADWHRSR